ncbi:MAG: hypothetical protein AB1761_08280 [Pseudomonadota bacterium]
MAMDIETELRAIHAKLDQLLAAVEELRAAKRAKGEAKRARKEKLPPLTDDEIKAHQVRFAGLFERWRAGNELDVQTELESMDAEQLRRFADANNLNVTSKMPVQKVLQLIGARFREKRQLLGGLRPRPEGNE